MATFLLIHGAWHGGWCFGRLRAALERRGHVVAAPVMVTGFELDELMAEPSFEKMNFETLTDTRPLQHEYEMGLPTIV